LSVLLFGAFFLWWKGVVSGHVSMLRWVSIAILLAAAGLTKGPQPIAYFTLGVGAYLIVKRHLGDISGFVFSNAVAGLAVAAWYCWSGRAASPRAMPCLQTWRLPCWQGYCSTAGGRRGPGS